MTKKDIQNEELPHELFLTTRQKTKIRSAFAKNMLTNIKPTKAKLPKIIKSGGFLGALLGKFVCPLIKVAVTFAKNVLAPLATLALASAINGVIQRCFA